MRLFDADTELKAISRELDSFDGKKDPIRCNLLVNRLRTSQDKVISLLFQLMDECNCERASRDYRMKFPDEILLSEGSESLNGQIWFGAECLSAGSNILNHTKESTLLRPMAKTLTTHLDSLRNDLRDLVIDGDGASRITPELVRKMVAFDNIFANFEYEYVGTMLPIRTVGEIEKLQEVAVLFSETLIDCLKRGLIKQADIDEFQPIVMIAIPRLAIVRGLLYKNENPIYTKRKSQMCSLFQPFHGPLHSIRKLLRVLDPIELFTLEKMLADDESAVEDSIADNKTAGDENNPTDFDLQQQCFCDEHVGASTSNGNYANALMQGLDYPVGQKRDVQQDEPNQSPSHNDPCHSTDDELKCKHLATSSSPNSTMQDPEFYPSTNSTSSASSIGCSTARMKECRATSSAAIQDNLSGRRSSESDAQVAGLISKFGASITNEDATHFSSAGGIRNDESSNSSTRNSNNDSTPNKTSDRNGQNDTDVVIEEIFVKQTQQLIHRLFVSISGVADQLQSNFASDLRFILRHIFVSEIEGSDGSSDQEGDEIRVSDHRDCLVSDNDSDGSLPIEPAIEAQEVTNLVDLNSSYGSDYEFHEQHGAANVSNDAHIHTSSAIVANSNHPRSATNTVTHPSMICSRDIPDANNSRIRQSVSIDGHIQPNIMNNGDGDRVHIDDILSPNEPSILEDNRHRQQIIQQQLLSRMGRISSRSQRYSHQALDESNAVRDQHVSVERRQRHHGSSRSRRQRGPPVWVPDQLVVACSCCNASFTLFRRRHHCRACGQIFCADCSKFTKNLNYWGYNRPVRVCEACFNQP